MKLLNSLYTIISPSEATTSTSADSAVDTGLPVNQLLPVNYAIRLNPEHVIYRAHFPEMPITPGVCIVQIVQELLSVTMHHEMEVTAAKNVKFLSVISPREVLNLNVIFKKIEEIEGNVKVQCVISDETTLFAKLSLTMKSK